MLISTNVAAAVTTRTTATFGAFLSARLSARTAATLGARLTTTGREPDVETFKPIDARDNVPNLVLGDPHPSPEGC